MKKYLIKTSYFISFLILVLSLYSFTFKYKYKEPINTKKQVPPNKWTLYKCVIKENGTYYYGAKCEVSAWEDCPKAVSCQKLLDDNGDPIPFNNITQLQNWGFIEDEIQNWQKIEEPFQSTTDYIKTHYLFFIATYNQGITFHPDDIIRRNK